MLPQGMKERPVSVLASADTAGVVVLSVCGAYRLITIDLRAHRKPAKGKGRTSLGGRASPAKDSPRQRRSRRSSGPDSPGFSGVSETDGDIDGTGPGLRPLQLTLSADLSLLTALVEVDGHVELIQVMRFANIKVCTVGKWRAMFNEVVMLVSTSELPGGAPLTFLEPRVTGMTDRWTYRCFGANGTSSSPWRCSSQLSARLLVV